MGEDTVPSTREELETLLLRLWADALAMPEIRADEDLVSRGAGSLALMSVVARVQEILERDIPPEVVLQTMFREPTVHAFTQAIYASVMMQGPDQAVAGG